MSMQAAPEIRIGNSVEDTWTSLDTFTQFHEH